MDIDTVLPRLLRHGIHASIRYTTVGIELTLERQLVLQELPTTPPSSLRTTPPSGQNRGRDASPEQAEARESDASHLINTSVLIRSRAEAMPTLMLINDRSCGRIDRDDWAAA
ncbi:hypothetical protein CCR75_007081 [Bremia lactucae]|uniref:Uncharacterized protein n=1 Tax=Bremia lactucae TaxID=4779 RepID=A0A976FFY3_BRELC|nr:hypothetical protein CCR75_007081 [Bremia lactucae]